MSSKNFAVSFNNTDAHKSLFVAYYRQIMEIMLVIDENTDYDMAMNNKIGIIQSYLTKDISNVEYIIYIYGFAEALTEYKARFGNRDIEPSVLMFDLATLVIDNCISVYEVYSEKGNYIPEHLENTDRDGGDGGDGGVDISSIYCENSTDGSLDIGDVINASLPVYSSSFSEDDYNDE